MCGIAGFVSAEINAYSTTERLLTQMRHRGPDGESYINLRSQHHHLLFCHARLSILDLSTAADQPMIDEQTGCTLIFNGEIYNYLDIRAELMRHDNHLFHSTGDTEVLLRAYLTYGIDFIKRLRGMFAFALYDPRQEFLLIARDPFGIKPLYYTLFANKFAFASEVRTLFTLDGVKRRLDYRGLTGYLNYGSVQDPYTLVEDIYALPAGHYALIDLKAATLQDISPRAYWSLPHELNTQISVHEAKNLTYQALSDSVHAHLISDVDLGVFLSGGLDSMAIVALMSKHTPDHVCTLTVAFDEAAYDESAQARRIAEHFGTQHIEVRIRPYDFLNQVDAWLASYDMPSNDGANVWIISQACRQAGLKVAITGLGGDELFAGYSNFQRTVRAANYLPWLRSVPLEVRHLIAKGMTQLVPSSAKIQKSSELLESDGSLLNAYLATRKMFTSSMSSQLIAPVWKQVHSPDVWVQWLEWCNNSNDVSATVSLLEISGYMRNTLLRDSDQMAMAHSLELRVPFVDKVVIDVVLSIPSNIRLNGAGSKPFLREVIKHDVIPDWLNAPKQGFAFPFDQWLRGPLRKTVEASLDVLGNYPFHPNAVKYAWEQYLRGSTAFNAGRIMTLFVLAHWLQQHDIEMGY